MTNILDNLGINRDLLIIFLAAMSLILLVVLIIILIKTRKVFQRYDYFMRGKDAESLEDKINEIYQRTELLKEHEMEHRDRIKKLQMTATNAYCKTGIVRYNAFNGMGGQSSFVLVLLDHEDNGFLLNAMHSRSSCFLYTKDIKKGKPVGVFSDEENEALKKALS